jgi:polyhydroxyalkanoate synthesis regulator phasin
VTPSTSPTSSTSIPFYLFPLIVLEAAPDNLINVNSIINSQNALHCILNLSEEDMKLIQDTLREGKKPVEDLHRTRVAIASSLSSLGCCITQEDKHRITPWGQVKKGKNKKLQNRFLEQVEKIQLDSKRSVYIDFNNHLSSTHETGSGVYVGFLKDEVEMRAVKHFTLKSSEDEKKFAAEVENMKSVKNSNHVVKFIDSTIVKGRGRTTEGYIVMEKARHTVQDVIERRKGATTGDDEAEEEFRINILAQSVDALVYIHKKDSIVHLDLKPDNIFVGEDERLVENDILIRNMLNQNR